MSMRKIFKKIVHVQNHSAIEIKLGWFGMFLRLSAAGFFFYGDLMDNFFINWPNILKLIIILYRYHICTYNCKQIVDLKNEFLRFYFWRFIEVKLTMIIEYTTYLIR